MCVLLLYTLYVSGGGRDSLRLKNGKSGWGTYTFISKNRLKSLVLKKMHIISSCNTYINLRVFIKQNLNIFEK